MATIVKIALVTMIILVLVGVADFFMQGTSLLPSLPQDTLEKETRGNEQYSSRVLELEQRIDETVDRSVLLRLEQQVRSILEVPASSSEEAQAKLLLAKIFIYKYANNQSIIQGIELITEVAKNTAYPNLWRAMALDRASHLIRDVADDEYLAILWNDDLFKTYYDSALPDVGSIKNICEASFALYPLPLCSYRIAGFELARLIEDKVVPKLSAEERVRFLADAKEKVAAGNSAFMNYPLPYISLFDKGKIYLLQGNRQVELYVLGEELPADFREKAEDNLKQAYDIFNSGQALPVSEEGFISYYYAVFLAQVYGQDRISDITMLTDSLIQRYSQNRNMPFFLYMKKIASQVSDPDAPRKVGLDTALLAQMNPRFKTFLVEELKWSERFLSGTVPQGIIE